jgi:uncharacterized cupredoxin-like copper-binding protein
MRVRLLATTLGSLALLFAACTGGASPSPSGAGGGPSTIAAELKEWEIKLDSATGAAGSVTFNVNNKGEKEHEFVIVKTDQKAASLPVTADDEVDESAFTPVDEIEDIKPATTPTLTVDLQAGHYVILCNLTGHYSKGMHADFDVS